LHLRVVFALALRTLSVVQIPVTVPDGHDCRCHSAASAYSKQRGTQAHLPDFWPASVDPDTDCGRKRVDYSGQRTIVASSESSQESEPKPNKRSRACMQASTFC
jgi:hypothetical protein